jgi:acetyl-CoA carboxylase biotin carboxylase subunit
VIAHGKTREEAIATMLRTLAESKVEGVPTTIPLHIAVLDSAEFRAGKYDTRALPGWKSGVRG